MERLQSRLIVFPVITVRYDQGPFGLLRVVKRWRYYRQVESRGAMVKSEFWTSQKRTRTYPIITLFVTFLMNKVKDLEEKRSWDGMFQIVEIGGVETRDKEVKSPWWSYKNLKIEGRNVVTFTHVRISTL